MSLDDLQAQLRGALDQQFAALKEQYESSIEEARRQAAVEVEREFVAKLEHARAEFQQARTEWESQLQELVIAARADAEQCATQALAVQRQEYEQQLQAQFEQRVEHAVGAARRTAELERESEQRRAQNELDAERERAKAALDAERQQADQAQQQRDTERQQQLQKVLAAERQKLQQDLAAGRQRAQQEVEALTERHQSEIAAARQASAAAVAAAKAAIPPAPAPPAGLPAGAFDRLLAAITDLDAAGTLGHALDALLAHAGAVAGRAALFLIDGDRLKAWKSAGIPDIDVQTVESSIGGKDLLARAIQAGHAIPSSPALPAPPFARLPADRAGLAAPVMIGGRAVAVLYADSGAKPTAAGSAETIELLVRHASAVVALRTAMRTLDVLRGVPAGTPDGQADEQSARRFARLLVSEIKLYNEAAVRAGQQQRDLRQRLRAEIDRAQRLYEERVPPGLGARSAYFQQELVQTLADGDAALLGNA